MKIKQNKIVVLLDKLKFLFFWIYWFYPKGRQTPIAFMLYCFLPQKLLRINGAVKWPVHFTSKVFNHGNIEVGNNSSPGLNISCYIQGRCGIKIGNNLRMGPGVGLISANHDVNDYDQWVDVGPILIGNDVWLGMNVVILPGVTLGDNVIIAANSVVSKDIPSNSIAAGAPCKVIKQKGPYLGKKYNDQ